MTHVAAWLGSGRELAQAGITGAQRQNCHKGMPGLSFFVFVYLLADKMGTIYHSCRRFVKGGSFFGDLSWLVIRGL